MNILYLSKLSGNPWAGPTYSVPEQIYAQSFVDNVFWFNLNHQRKKEWDKRENFYHNLDDFPPSLCFFPSPFSAPDLVIIEGFYNFFLTPIITEIQKKNIPYILVPRGEMNYAAQKSKRLKKAIANLLWFNRMVEKSIGIEYLSENERDCSLKWKGKKSVVIPNGINLVNHVCKKDLGKGIKAVFIGRLDVYHKGIDSLLGGVKLVANHLRSAGLKLFLYGPEWNNSRDWILKNINENKIDDIVSLENAVYGSEKENVLNSADIFVLTSRFEGMPMGLLEAMSCGLPCLVTPGTNMSEKVVQKNAGWSTNCDAESISQALLTIVCEKIMYNEKSLNALSLASDYSWTSIAAKSHLIYEDLLKGV